MPSSNDFASDDAVLILGLLAAYEGITGLTTQYVFFFRRRLVTLLDSLEQSSKATEVARVFVYDA